MNRRSGGDYPREVEAAGDACLPSNALGRPAHYTVWEKATRVLERAESELSNNPAENSMSGFGPEELDPRRQPQAGGDSVDSGDMPARTRIPIRDDGLPSFHLVDVHPSP